MLLMECCRSHVAASVENGTYEISSLFKFIHKDSTSYDISGKIRSLDLADLLKDHQYSSDLSFDFTATGTIGASTRSDATEMHFYRSSFAPQMFESAQAKVMFQVKDSVHSILQITSTMGGFGCEWQFHSCLVYRGVAKFLSTGNRGNRISISKS